MSTLGVSNLKRHDEYYLRDGNVCFLVGNTTFRLHRHFFERESDYFLEKLKPSSDGEDGSLSSPYRIDNVKSEEFAQFIWVWYNPRYSFSRQDKQSWLTILRLATEWRFPEIRKLAIRQLERVRFDSPIEKITTYKEYAVDNELLLPEYASLCRSPDLPSPEEGKKLTMETVIKIARARERLLVSASERGSRTPLSALPDDLVNATVAELFGLALQSNGQNVGLEGQMNNGNALGNGSVDPEVVTVKQPKPGTKKGKADASVDGTSVLQNRPTQANGINGAVGKGKQKETPVRP